MFSFNWNIGLHSKTVLDTIAKDPSFFLRAGFKIGIWCAVLRVILEDKFSKATLEVSLLFAPSFSRGGICARARI